MKRLVVLLAALIFGRALSGEAVDRSDSRPNIIFLFSDDQTDRAIGYNNPDVLTPQFDRLANDGVRFANHYNTTSICMASRCSVLTGLYEYRHGCNFEHGDLSRRFVEQSYPALLRNAGYFTGFAGKVGFVIDGEPFESIAGVFDRWAGGPGQTFYETEKNAGIARYAERYPHCSRAYAAWSEDFLQEAKSSGRPFCLSISFKAPHLPFTPDPIDLRLYAGKSFTRPPNYGVENAEHLSRQAKTSRAWSQYREWINEYDESARNYYALITGVDAAVGMIRESLEREGLADNTVILFTSDNGYNCGAHGFGDKVLPYEEASKSPLIIYDPRLPKQHAGQTCEAVTGNVDMAPTILALAGVPAPEGLDGRSLVPLLTSPAGSVRDALPLFNFWGTDTAQSMAIVTPEWKYIVWYSAAGGLQPTEEFFDLGRDQFEMHNLANDPDCAADLAAMRRFYDAELLALRHGVVDGHGYEPYPVLFDRSVDWEQKEPLLRVKEPSSPTPEGAAPKRKRGAGIE
jgi:arylsulfatase A-like enzyme